MRKKLNRLLAAATMTAMVGTMLLSVSQVSAEAATSISDTLSREKVSVTLVTHKLVMTIPAASWANTETIIATYTNFTAIATTPDCALSGASTCTAAVSGANVLTITCTFAGGCNSQTLTVGGVTPFTMTNPGSADSYPVSFTGSSTVTGTFAIPITADDQISVTASVSPSITFQVVASTTTCSHATSGSSTDHTPTGDGGTVAFGTLSPTTVGSSDAASVQHVCTFVSTNAASGYALTVKSLNGQLKSTSTPADAIPTSAQLSGNTAFNAGTPQYGLCLSDTTVPNMDTTDPAGTNLTGNATFTTGTCTGTTADGDSAGKLTTSTQTIGSNTTGVQEGTAQWLLKAAISTTTTAHTDYADTLTFIATGTF